MGNATTPFVLVPHDVGQQILQLLASPGNLKVTMTVNPLPKVRQWHRKWTHSLVLGYSLTCLADASQQLIRTPL
jgi:hypothetical protein